MSRFVYCSPADSRVSCGPHVSRPQSSCMVRHYPLRICTNLSVTTLQNVMFFNYFFPLLFPFQKSEGEDKDKKKEIVVLEMKRSQAINIGLTKLPPIRALKQAILSMDSAVIDREGIDVSMTQSMICYKKLPPPPLHQMTVQGR